MKYELINLRLSNIILPFMHLDKKDYSIVNIGSVQSYISIPYRSACNKKIQYYLNLLYTIPFAHIFLF